MKNDNLNVAYITGLLLKPENDYNSKPVKSERGFNWGFFTGILFSFIVWLVIFYLFK